MNDFERIYYEHDAFWNPDLTRLGDLDRLRVEHILEKLPPSARRIGDLGCGNGLFSHLAQQSRRWEVVAVDRSIAALRYAPYPKVASTLEALPFGDRVFDCSVVLEVLEHLPVPIYDRVLNEIGRVTKSQILITVPNQQQLGRAATSCPSCKTRFDPDLHLRSFSASTLRQLLSRQGFRCAGVEEEGWHTSFLGVDKLKGALTRSGPSEMASPICPVCGYRNAHFLNEPPVPTTTQSGPAKEVLKRLWPKKTRARWLTASYERR